MTKKLTTKNHLTNRFRVGENAKMIAISNTVRIKNIPVDDQLTKISQVLKYVFTLIGLKGDNLPSKVEKIVLMNFIIDNLSHFSIEDIRLAFELGVKGTFKVNMTHFQKFSSIYLCDVLNAYTEHKRIILKDYINESKNLLPEKIVSLEEKIKIFEDWFDNQLVVAFDEYKKTKELNTFLPSQMFLMLEDAGIIYMPKDQKLDIFEQSKQEYLKTLDSSSSYEDRRKKNKIKDLIQDQGINTQSQKIKNIARIKALKLWFDDLTDQKSHISSFKNKFLNHKKNQENGKNIKM
tara:strand:- start:6666 stop:7541 length:876 start_codon:yes stop_codon:yes gene_type:complete